MSDLQTIAKQNGLAEADPLAAQLDGFQKGLAPILDAAKRIVVTDATQVTEIKHARTARLQLRQIRIDVEKTRKAFKEESLRRGKAVDALARTITDQIEPEESRLQAMEDFAERAEAKRKQARAEARAEKLETLGEAHGFYDLVNMPEEQFGELVTKLEAARRQRDADVVAEAQALREVEEMEAAERRRVAEENARLKKEADERAAALKAEQEARQKEQAVAEALRLEEKRKADERLQKERFERAAAEQKIREEAEEKSRQERAASEAIQRKQAAELAAANAARATVEADARSLADALHKKRVAEAEAKREEERQKKAQDRLLALQPDRDKLLLYFQNLRAVPTPTVSAVEASDLMGKFEEDFDLLILWAMNLAKALN